ncbi:MAG: hypothetical protein FWC61_03335 [Proteobacteria bacterium]|nr:hypothetical protein [Pseudomonadota bacterium]
MTDFTDKITKVKTRWRTNRVGYKYKEYHAAEYLFVLKCSGQLNVPAYRVVPLTRPAKGKLLKSCSRELCNNHSEYCLYEHGGWCENGKKYLIMNSPGIRR